MQDKKLTCQQTQEYIDGLSQRQFQEKTEGCPEYEHIQQCEACKEYFEQAKSLAEKLDQWNVPNPQSNITAGVMAQIAQLEHDKKIDRFSISSRLPALFIYRLKVPFGVAAAVFVMLAISVFFNIAKLNIYPGSKEGIQAKTEQSIPEELKFANRIKPKTYPVSIQPDGNGQMCFFGVSPETSQTPIIIILGVPGVMPLETRIQPVRANLSNQRL